VGVSGADIQALTGNLNFFDTRLIAQAAPIMQKNWATRPKLTNKGKCGTQSP